MLEQVFSVASAGGESIQTRLFTANAPGDWGELVPLPAGGAGTCRARGSCVTSPAWGTHRFRGRWVGREAGRVPGDKGRRWHLCPAWGSDYTLLCQQQKIHFLLSDFLSRSSQSLLEPFLFQKFILKFSFFQGNLLGVLLSHTLYSRLDKAWRLRLLN